MFLRFAMRSEMEGGEGRGRVAGCVPAIADGAAGEAKPAGSGAAPRISWEDVAPCSTLVSGSTPPRPFANERGSEWLTLPDGAATCRAGAARAAACCWAPPPRTRVWLPGIAVRSARRPTVWAEGRDVEGRDVEGRDIEGRDIEGRDVEGRDIERRDVEGRRN